MDVENILSTASEEDLIKIRQALKTKSKYQKKGVYREKENKVRFFNPDELERKNKELQIEIQSLAMNTTQIVRELKNYIFRLLNLNTTENY